MNSLIEARKKCYSCYRPKSSCMCSHVNAITTNTKFVLLMHPKEFRKIKNGTGHLTHLSLKNSELHIGIDFSLHKRVNELIDDENNISFLLYPTKDSHLLNSKSIKQDGKTTVIFILDATWDCSKKMLRTSTNLQKLDAISFTHTKESQFKIKEQPLPHCLSTIESTLCVLELLTQHRDESLLLLELEQFLDPFKEMIAYQQSHLLKSGCGVKNAVRYKPKRSNLES